MSSNAPVWPADKFRDKRVRVLEPTWPAPSVNYCGWEGFVTSTGANVVEVEFTTGARAAFNIEDLEIIEDEYQEI